VRYIRHRKPIEEGCVSCAATFGFSEARALLRLPRQVEASPRVDELDPFLRAELHRLVDLPSAASLDHRAPSLIIRQRPAEPRSAAGRYYYQRRHIHVFVWPGVHPAYVLSTMAHELAHAVAGYEAHHRRPWKDAFIALLREGYGVSIKRPRATWELDFRATRGLYEQLFRGVSSLTDVGGPAPTPHRADPNNPNQLTLNL
jgi:hypothetical protein